VSSSDTRRDLIIEAWTAAWDHGDVDALDQLLSPDYRRRTDAEDTGQDRTEFKASIIATRSAFPDLITTIDEVVVEGDQAAVRWHSSGATFARFAGDRVVEEFVTWDPRALLSALGIISVGQDF